MNDPEANLLAAFDESAELDAERQHRIDNNLLHCPVVTDDYLCGAEVQLSRKTFWSVDEDTLFQAQSDQPDLWSAYCQHDHQLYQNFEAYASEVIADLKRLFVDHPPSDG